MGISPTVVGDDALDWILCGSQVLGCCVIGYMAWVLATSTSVNRFLSGTLVIHDTVTARTERT